MNDSVNNHGIFTDLLTKPGKYDTINYRDEERPKVTAPQAGIAFSS
jgi:hypothetical protein